MLTDHLTSFVPFDEEAGPRRILDKDGEVIESLATMPLDESWKALDGWRAGHGVTITSAADEPTIIG